MNTPAVHAFTDNAVLLHLVSDFSVQDPAAQPPTPHPYIGMWDTGATCSGISRRVIDALGLAPLAEERRVTALAGNVLVPQYRIDLVLPALYPDGRAARVEGLQVIQTPSLPNPYRADSTIDLLIGMDVITRGTLGVSFGQQQTAFRFELP